MSQVSLDIELDEPRRVYRLGDDIAGQVRVVANRFFSCRELVVRVQYETEGKGDSDSGVEGEVELFSGTIAENLRVAKAAATDQELVDACTAANAHDWACCATIWAFVDEMLLLAMSIISLACLFVSRHVTL